MSLAVMLSLLSPFVAASPGVSARWTSSTIPAIAVHLVDAAGSPVADARVVLRGPGGEHLKGHTDAEGNLTHVFLPVGHWQVSVYQAQNPTHDIWVELSSRQRADVDLVVQADTLRQPAAALHAPVVRVDEANRGSRALVVALRQAPL